MEEFVEAQPVGSGKNGLLQRLAGFLGLRRSMTALLGMVILVGLGEKMAGRFLPKYLVALGGGTTAIGLFSGLHQLLTSVYFYSGGYLSDRLGHRRALMLFNLMALPGFLVASLARSWPLVIIASVSFVAWSVMAFPAMMSMVAHVLPQGKRTMGVSMHSLAARIPMAVGPVVGGALLQVFGITGGMRIAFGIALALGIGSLLLQRGLLSGNEGIPAARAATANPLQLLKGMPPDLRSLLLSEIVVRFGHQIPLAFVVIWCLDHASISPLEFGVLIAIETVTSMLTYVPVAHLADRSASKEPFVAITFLFFALSPFVLLFSRSLPMLVLAFIVRGLREFGEPARKVLIVDLSPEGQKGSMFGFYCLVRGLIVSVAAFAGAFLWRISPQANFLSAFGLGLLGTLFYVLSGRYLRRRREEASAQVYGREA